jgi:hypothetical protein
VAGILPASNGGTGLNTGGATGVPYIAAGTWNYETALALSRGGTGKQITASAGALVYSDADSFELSAVGGAGQLLTSNGAGAPTWANASSIISAGDDLDITGTTTVTLSLEDAIEVSSISASSPAGLSFNDDGANLALFIEDGGMVGVGINNPVADLHIGSSSSLLQIDGVDDLYVYDDIELDGELYIGNIALYQNIIGNRDYTEANYISDNQTFTASFDSIDQHIYDLTIGSAGLWRDTTSYIYANNYSDYVITDSGLLGIGTTNPGEKIEVANATKARIEINGLGVNGDAGLLFSENNVNSMEIVFDGEDDRLYFTDVIGNLPRMTLERTGNVGIGDTSPDSPLEVLSTNTQFRLSYVDGTDTTFGVNSSGHLTITPTGAIGNFAGSFLPTIADNYNLGSTSAEWNAFYLGDDAGTYFGQDQDWSFLYDESTDDRLELTTTGTSGMLISSATTTGTGLNLAFNSLTSGIGLNLDYSPTSPISYTGDIFKINVGSNASLTSGDIFDIIDNGSSIFTIDQTLFSTSLPANFTASGDVSVAYDLRFMNQSGSSIYSDGPLNDNKRRSI